MHGAATAVSQAVRVVHVLHGGESKARYASDVERFHAPDPAPTHVTDTGVVGATLSCLRHAAEQSSSAVGLAPRAPPASASPLGSAPQEAPPAERPDAATAVAFVVACNAAGVPRTTLPEHALTTCDTLAASARLDMVLANTSVSPSGVASSNHDEGWGDMVALAIRLSPRQQRARTEVAASWAGVEFDAAKLRAVSRHQVFDIDSWRDMASVTILATAVPPFRAGMAASPAK